MPAKPAQPSSRKSRRLFLNQLSTAALALPATSWLVGPVGAADQPAIESAPIPIRKIPSSGEALPIIGLGTARTFNVEPSSSSVAQLREVLQRFHQFGGRVVDSSPMYGHSEALTGMMARQLGITDDLFIATKVWTEGLNEGNLQMDTSAKHFQTDVIDLMQIHNLVDLETQLASIRERREQGRVRYVGVTHYRDDIHDSLAELLMREHLDFVQINYSIVSRNAEKRLLPVAAERGVAVIINQAFERGRLFNMLGDASLPEWVGPLGINSWAQYLLKFVLSNSAVTTVIPAASKVEYVNDNMLAAFGPMPDEKMRQRMAAHIQTII